MGEWIYDEILGYKYYEYSVEYIDQLFINGQHDELMRIRKEEADRNNLRREIIQKEIIQKQKEIIQKELDERVKEWHKYKKINYFVMSIYFVSCFISLIS